MSDTSSSDSGVGIVEIFDADGSTANRLVNLSSLSYTGTGDEIQTSGFSITGSVPRTVFIHSWGSSLSAFGISGYIPDTEITVFNSSETVIATNDDWGSNGNAFAERVGHEPFASPGASTDSALSLRLQPGSYSVQVIGKSGTTGTDLLEIDEF